MTTKKTKTVKELNIKLNVLNNTVRELTLKIETINKYVTLKIKDLEAKLKIQYNTEKTKNVSSKKEYKCKKCEYKSNKSFELEQHIKNTHEEEGLKCKICDKTFVMNWRLRKHEEGHNKQTKMCHYFNNNRSCPYENVGCMFMHEESLPCKFGEKCKIKLCQYRHVTNHIENVHINSHASNSQSNYVSDIDQNKVNESDDNNLNNTENANIEYNEEAQDNHKEVEAIYAINSSSPEYLEARKLYCATYCDEKWDLHIHDHKTYQVYRGIDIFKYEDVFRCKICEYTSSDDTDHMEHFDEEHSDIDVSINCVVNNCKYKEEKPEALIFHMVNFHKKH